ncbi:MAG: DUF2800 domain-containing protein [candidate division Zixibacteria bacterium]|nr:DUF2800 domain-containing protein [candidate division Zixibacteria bacterium]
MALAGCNAGQWMKCNGSVQMQTLFPALPGEQSESAREGIASHEVTQKMLESFKDATEQTLTMVDVIGTTSSNGVLITDEIAQAATDATTAVITAQPLGGLFDKMHIEQRIDSSFINPEMNYIKPDCYIWDDVNGILDIWDFKFGRRVVEVFENWQLILDAICLREHLDLTGFDDQHIRVRMRIFQPFASHIDGVNRVWECMLSDLRPFANALIDGARVSMTDDALCIPGEQCTYCTGRRGCESLSRSNYNFMDYNGHAIPHELKGLNLSSEYNLLKHYENLIKSRLSGIEEQVLHDIRNGEIVHGLGVTQGYGRQRWRKDVDQEEVIMMGEMMGVDLRKPRELTTPKKCLSLGVDESVIDAYSETPKTNLRVVASDETKARNVFR